MLYHKEITTPHQQQYYHIQFSAEYLFTLRETFKIIPPMMLCCNRMAEWHAGNEVTDIFAQHVFSSVNSLLRTYFQRTLQMVFETLLVKNDTQLDGYRMFEQSAYPHMDLEVVQSVPAEVWTMQAVLWIRRVIFMLYCICVILWV